VLYPWLDFVCHVRSDYAYGERGIPGLIPSRATLYLEVTLIAIH